MTPEIYPGRSVIVVEMLAAWKARNEYRRMNLVDWHLATGYRLAALRRVWKALRALG
jgi:hypothetical protein